MRRAARSWSAGLLCGVLAGSLTVLTSLCHASRPDPTWIAGLYDDADHDDVVLDLLGLVATPPVTSSPIDIPVVRRSTPALVRAVPPASPGRRIGLDRAPPLA